jgi:5'-3' exonuclease
MGVKGLKQFLRDYNLIYTKKLTDFRNCKIAVDISCFLYKYKIIKGDDWGNSFLHLITNLRKCDIHCVFIFDGIPPIDKDNEKLHRKENKDNLDNLVDNLQKDLQNYINTQQTTQLLLNTMDKIKSKDDLKVKRLLKSKNVSVIDVNKINEYITKKTSQSIRITSEDTKKAQDILKAFDIQYIMAPSEAESMCAYLCKIKSCIGVITEDTDILTYKTDVYISNIDTSRHTCDVIYLNEVLPRLNLNIHQFVDFCIMCKVDYNNNVPKIGIKSAYKLILEHKNLENIFKLWDEKDVDYSMLRYLRCRDIFYTFNNLRCRLCQDIFPNYKIQNCKYPCSYCEKCYKYADIEYAKSVSEIPENENVQLVSCQINITKEDFIKSINNIKYWNININLENTFDKLDNLYLTYYKDEIIDAWKPIELEFISDSE